MDIEANPIQIQTPPKEDEIENLPETIDPMEPFKMVEKPGEEKEEDEDMREDVHNDEIVVEDAEAGVEEGYRNRDQDSSLSSPPDYEDGCGVSKTRTLISFLKVTGRYHCRNSNALQITGSERNKTWRCRRY